MKMTEQEREALYSQSVSQLRLQYRWVRKLEDNGFNTIGGAVRLLTEDIRLKGLGMFGLNDLRGALACVGVVVPAPTVGSGPRPRSLAERISEERADAVAGERERAFIEGFAAGRAATVAEMHAAGFTYTDLARALGISPPRMVQIGNKGKRALAKMKPQK